MRKVIAILLLFVVSSVSAQITSPAKQWDKRFGGDNSDELNSLDLTFDGGYILGGHSYSHKGGDKSEYNQGVGDFWIVKTDKDGIKQWDKTFGGTDDDFLQCLQQTNDGGYILGGWSLPPGVKINLKTDVVAGIFG